MNEQELIAFCDLLDSELRRRDTLGHVSLLAAGAAFEQWLSFEARLVMEQHRDVVGVRPSWWTANEYRKVDLGVWEGWSTLHAGIEFKLIGTDHIGSHRTDSRHDVAHGCDLQVYCSEQEVGLP